MQADEPGKKFSLHGHFFFLSFRREMIPAEVSVSCPARPNEHAQHASIGWFAPGNGLSALLISPQRLHQGKRF